MSKKLTDQIHHSCELSETKVIDYTTAVYVDGDGLKPDYAELPIAKGETGSTALEGVEIRSDQPGASAVIVNGGQYAIADAKIEMKTAGDGKEVCDFVGLGSAVDAFSGAKVTVKNSVIETTGVAKCAIFADDGSDVVVENCSLSAMGGKLYDGYINSADFNYMVAPPWVLGIMGNARVTNLMGEKASTALINCDITASNWGAVSTDNGEHNLLTVADTTLTLTGIAGEKETNPYFKKYGSGYGTYILGCHEDFYGVTMNVGTYIGIARDGSAVYRSSNGVIRHVSPTTGQILYEGQGKGRKSILNSDGFGIMAHGWANITLTDGTEMNTADAAFLLRCGGIKINVEDKAQINTASGVILQVIDDDDASVGVDWDSKIELEFHREFNEKAGWPSENGQISSMMPPPPPPPPMPEGEEPPPPPQFDVNFRAADVVLKGNLYNGSGYYGQKAKQLYVTLDAGAKLTGTISATETIHVNEKGEQNTHFTIDQYYYLGHVANRNYLNGDNAVEVTMNAGSVWTVTEEGLLTALTVNEGAAFHGKLTVNGTETVPEAGKTYTGELVVAPK